MIKPQPASQYWAGRPIPLRRKASYISPSSPTSNFIRASTGLFASVMATWPLDLLVFPFWFFVFFELNPFLFLNWACNLIWTIKLNYSCPAFVASSASWCIEKRENWFVPSYLFKIFKIWPYNIGKSSWGQTRPWWDRYQLTVLEFSIS
jgi:hypothetical protein